MYPIAYEKNLNWVLIKLVEVTALINTGKQIETITQNFVVPFKHRDDLKIANRDLKFNEENYHLLLNNINDYAIYMLDEEGPN